jgi:large subunit ribosomal protein L21
LAGTNPALLTEQALVRIFADCILKEGLNMYAVIANGGKQYKVEPGQVLRLEKMSGEVGETVSLSPVLMVGGEGEPQVGQPHLDGQVTATILDQDKQRKILVFKMKRRKGFRVKRGHRQPYTAVRIEAIEV